MKTLTSDQVAKLFGVPVSGVRAQYAKNAAQVRTMIATGDLRGGSVEQLERFANHAEKQAKQKQNGI